METGLLPRLLFQYLSHIFGSEKAVRARRLFYGVQDCWYFNNTRQYKEVVSGSKAEGLDFPDSDLDVMWIYFGEVVFPDVRSCPQNDFPRSLYITTDDAPPGYAHINVQINPYDGLYDGTPAYTFRGKAVDLVYTESGILLQNCSFKNVFEILLDDYFIQYPGMAYTINHGPCQSFPDGLVDDMFSFELYSWPNIASGWILRPRLSDWPSERLMSNIVHESVLLVPIGSKFGSLTDNPNEWRISFSISEKLLVHSFNHTQLMCYVLLKILLKEILNTNVVTKNLLCSYFMKTILFWTIEETGCSVWTPNNLVKCFCACITKLSYLLKQNHLPNYFIPENNMIEGKLSDHQLSDLCSALDQVNNEGVGFTRRTDTLQDYLTSLHRNLTITYQADEMHVLCSLLTTELPMINEGPELRGQHIFFLNSFKTKLIRYLFYCHFLSSMTSAFIKEKYDINRTNKSLYCNYKSILGYSLIGAKLRLSSWLTVAIIFYSHKNYNDTLRITDFIQSENLNMRNVSLNYENTMQGRLSILQMVKLRCCKLFVNTVAIYISGSVIAKTDLWLNFSLAPDNFVIFSRSFLAYIRFMCFHYLQNVSKKRNAFFDLLKMLEEEVPNKYTCFQDFFNKYLFVFKAYFMSKSNLSIPEIILIARFIINCMSNITLPSQMLCQNVVPAQMVNQNLIDYIHFIIQQR